MAARKKGEESHGNAKEVHLEDPPSQIPIAQVITSFSRARLSTEIEALLQGHDNDEEGVEALAQSWVPPQASFQAVLCEKMVGMNVQTRFTLLFEGNIGHECFQWIPGADGSFYKPVLSLDHGIKLPPTLSVFDLDGHSSRPFVEKWKRLTGTYISLKAIQALKLHSNNAEARAESLKDGVNIREDELAKWMC
ncbi:hypothetical protein Nepgr_004096 [Nepenthes gracilis]|uniref:Uncharacterized protein n=1 Tax=Nepenthes gracilis TaxID=150966 RepID=A0AAD3S0X2_NEPGR|nr:hypothetical protein Nepgr_004096 [Nepenthes gracilis]